MGIDTFHSRAPIVRRERGPFSRRIDLSGGLDAEAAGSGVARFNGTCTSITGSLRRRGGGVGQAPSTKNPAAAEPGGAREVRMQARMTEQPKYRLAWISRATGFSGRGSPIDRRAAEALAATLNERYPDLRHWIEPAPEEEPERTARNEEGATA